MKNIIKKMFDCGDSGSGHFAAPGSVRTSKKGSRKLQVGKTAAARLITARRRVLTVGIGSTGGVENREYSNQEIARRWINDLQRAENCINNNFHGADMPQLTFEAMTDAALNLGCTGLMWFNR